ncbi:MAG TPA: pyridoxal phosphate-dependent aminotransferase [Candidatus Dormibacteraeota bacterium]|nr:pyridoxal phosphate-dependent aminotransferase [Candidatus Dormibacteraeota bacterium]
MSLTIRPAERMERIPFSGIRRIFEAAAALEREGRDIVHLTVGRPDFDTPEHIKRAAREALDAGLVHYTSNYGLVELRRAIVRKLAADNGLAYDESEVLVVQGASQAIAVAIQGFLGPGDELLVPSPAYLNYLHCATLAGAVAVPVPLRDENDFQLDPDDVIERITPRTRMLVVNTPQNPTGAVCPPDVLRRIAEIACERDLLVLSDEIYEKLVYGSFEHASMAAFPGMKERTFTVNGFAKAYSMTGWRIGYVAAPKPLIDVMVRIVQYTTVCPTSFAQAGAVAALEGPQEPVARMRAEFDRRRHLVQQRLAAVPGLTCARLQGAFYAFPDVTSYGLSDDDLADRLLVEAGVAVVPGSAFGPGGAGHVRISYATDYDRLAIGLERLADGLERLSRG